jgi:ABC-type polysaccharide/polyol phosphate transport system ATPase subunit
MVETALEVCNVSKKYQIGRIHARTTAKEYAAGILLEPVRRVRSMVIHQLPTGAETEFWALKDVSFAVPQGETFGIVGTNGSGKSTLLKIIASIVRPTEGYAKVRGRVSSLLEIGSGFNVELSGRENVYINGILLGMNRRTIDEKFDSILDFAGIHEFIDTPLKRYSTGMMARLAFSVAVHLDPEIMIIDEVLAVGDYAFIQKSLGKIKEIAQSGTTVIMVSHITSIINEMCDRVMWLEKGQVIKIGETEAVTQEYLETILRQPKPKASASDIATQQEELEKVRRQAIFDGVKAQYPADSFMVVKSDGLIYLASPEFAQLIGQPENELAGCPVTSLDCESLSADITQVITTKQSIMKEIMAYGRRFQTVIGPVFETQNMNVPEVTGASVVLRPLEVKVSFPVDSRKRLQILSAELTHRQPPESKDEILLKCTYEVRKALEGSLLCVEVRNVVNVSVYYSNDEFLYDERKRNRGTHTVTLSLPVHILAAGYYTVAFGFFDPARKVAEDFPKERLSFVQVETPSRLTDHGIAWPSVIHLPERWTYLESDTVVVQRD